MGFNSRLKELTSYVLNYVIHLSLNSTYLNNHILWELKFRTHCSAFPEVRVLDIDTETISYEPPFANYTRTNFCAESRPLVGQLQGTFNLYCLLYVNRLKRSDVCYIQSAMTLDKRAVFLLHSMFSVSCDYQCKQWLFFWTALNHCSL
jgi:hypothetical protein